MICIIAYEIGLYVIYSKYLPTGKYWSPGRPEDVSLQRP